ncbi:hypothetical protein PR202_gb12632 [Eleusine coracana subsp. coracana]|uniref:Uncharacterized protein n=1 Tax=Eleusine coracana subsp. coracana TaxID=191504 RepID=A0AAV5EQZ9_ELECO|nr:hypothetical protein PR202_gb12632 [Eleusine coracana subsp. coracana]
MLLRMRGQSWIGRLAPASRMCSQCFKTITGVPTSSPAIASDPRPSKSNAWDCCLVQTAFSGSERQVAELNQIELLVSTIEIDKLIQN